MVAQFGNQFTSSLIVIIDQFDFIMCIQPQRFAAAFRMCAHQRVRISMANYRLVFKTVFRKCTVTAILGRAFIALEAYKRIVGNQLQRVQMLFRFII